MASFEGATAPRADSAEFNDCIAVIRSLVLIRKGITTLRDINGDYYNMEGENIPFSRFIFRSLEEMLRSCGQFNVTKQISGQVLYHGGV